jgi:hypothetical protein
MFVTSLRRISGLLILLVSLLIFTWSVWPAKSASLLVGLPESVFTMGNQSNPQAGRVGEMQLVWPEGLQAGAGGSILLEIEARSLEPAQPADSLSAAVLPVQLEARLELPGVDTVPKGIIRQALPESQATKFTWHVRANRDGHYLGTLWLHSLVASGAIPGNLERRLVAALPLQIRASSLLGLGAYPAQVLGIIGILAGAALCFDWNRLLKLR